MNVYIFNENTRSSVFGVGTYIRELTNTLKESHIHIVVIHMRSGKEYIFMTEEDSIHHWYFPAPQVVNVSMDYEKQQECYYRNIVYLLKLHITDTRQLVFHLNSNRCKGLAISLKQTFDCHVFTVVHYSDWAIQLSGNLNRLKTILANIQPDEQDREIRRHIENDQLLYNTVDNVVCLSEYMQCVLKNEYRLNPIKISIIPNGLNDAPKITNSKSIRRRWLLSNREKIILFVGRLDDLKGIGYLIMAFRKVLLHHPESRLLIAGDGTYSTYMKISQDIFAKITYCGLFDKEKLFELYKIADIGVLPSFTEQCSYVAIEMMMHSLPMVTTAAPGLAEMTEDRISSLQIPIIEHPDRMEIDIDLLAEKILYLLEHPAEAKRLGKNARKRYEERYSGEVFRKNMIQFYESLFD